MTAIAEELTGLRPASSSQAMATPLNQTRNGMDSERWRINVPTLPLVSATAELEGAKATLEFRDGQ